MAGARQDPWFGMKCKPNCAQGVTDVCKCNTCNGEHHGSAFEQTDNVLRPNVPNWGLRTPFISREAAR
jgi:hypothetical protein